MGFATSVTSEETDLGFEAVRHLAHGTIVQVRLGVGLRAVKMVSDAGAIRYEICDDAGVILYQAASSLIELRRRFGLGDRKAG